MIKFSIHPKIQEGERCKFGGVLKNVKIIGFVDIFLDILHKMKNLSQGQVKRGLLSFKGKNWNNFPCYP